MRSPRSAFTLVELLVVIGIIAVLVGILLPALADARRQAQTVKCAAALKEIGNAYQLYAIDNKGWYPVAQIAPPVPAFPTYVVNDTGYPNASGVGAYWFNFLAKYVTKTKTGVEATNPSDTEQQRHRSLFWACPAWEGYFSGSGPGGGYNRVQTGYGMNAWPTYQPDYPKPFQYPPTTEMAFIHPQFPGKFFKQKQYTLHGSQRCVIADSKFWLAESEAPPTNGPYPPAVAPQADLNQSNTYTGNNQTLIDIYRHGKRPGALKGATQTVDPRGGKIAFNILYGDGHVATANTGDEAYRAIRMKFPG